MAKIAIVRDFGLHHENTGDPNELILQFVVRIIDPRFGNADATGYATVNLTQNSQQWEAAIRDAALICADQVSPGDWQASEIIQCALRRG